MHRDLKPENVFLTRGGVTKINVTNLFDTENTWFEIHEHVLRSGYAWVGVSVSAPV